MKLSHANAVDEGSHAKQAVIVIIIIIIIVIITLCTPSFTVLNKQLNTAILAPH
jgi:hypothetical protein